MSAVIEKPKNKVRPATPATAKVRKQTASSAPELFRQIGDLLGSASATDEPHAHSGDSDRLLNIASEMALRAAKANLSPSDAEGVAFDIAACIKAARLVPDDSESAERSALIGCAAQRLGILTELEADEVVKTSVLRPSRDSAPQPAASNNQFTEEQLNNLYWQAYVHMDCAKKVIFNYAENANSEEVFALRDLLDVYCKDAADSFDLKESGTLFCGPLPDLSASLSRILHLFYIVNDDNRDDGVLHGVGYLLQAAKRIADGDLGVLE